MVAMTENDSHCPLVLNWNSNGSTSRKPLSSGRVGSSPTPTFMNNQPEVKCPICGRKKSVVKKDDNVYHCSYCNQFFDPKED